MDLLVHFLETIVNDVRDSPVIVGGGGRVDGVVLGCDA